MINNKNKMKNGREKKKKTPNVKFVFDKSRKKTTPVGDFIACHLCVTVVFDCCLLMARKKVHGIIDYG